MGAWRGWGGLGKGVFWDLMFDHLGHVQDAIAVFFHWVPVSAWALASGIMCLLIQFCSVFYVFLIL